MSRASGPRPAGTAPHDGAGAASRRARSAYAAVTLAYWAFMLGDGALRMLVLLHFHRLGFTPLELAWLFLVYEAMGVATNLAAGWLGTRFGLKSTLLAGLFLQVGALVALAALDPAWPVALSIAFAMIVQGLSGVAKDLTKTSAKSALKGLVDEADGRLFRWVALLTGSKNAVKGAGFAVGAALLALVGFRAALLGLAATLALVGLAVLARLDDGLGVRRAKARFREVFSTEPAINRLAAARLFLFGTRDTWFVVGVPVFLHERLVAVAGVPQGLAFFAVGGFLALWIVLYGAVQASAPRWLAAAGRERGRALADARRWSTRLLLCLLPLAALALALPPFPEAPAPSEVSAVAAPATAASTADGVNAEAVADRASATGTVLTAAIVAGLFLFGLVFAINSSLHSYLVLALTSETRATMDVGFYYMANAGGRLLGTLLSGLSYQLGGLAGCLFAATAMAALARWFSGRLRG